MTMRVGCVLAISVAAGVAAVAQDPHVYYTLIPGHFAVVGRHPDGGAAYAGSAEISYVGGRFRLVKKVGEVTVVADGDVERAAIAEAEVVRFRWDGHEETCLVSSDLDNHARLGCHWTIHGQAHAMPGLEAYFSKDAWP